MQRTLERSLLQGASLPVNLVGEGEPAPFGEQMRELLPPQEQNLQALVFQFLTTGFQHGEVTGGIYNIITPRLRTLLEIQNIFLAFASLVQVEIRGETAGELESEIPPPPANGECGRIQIGVNLTIGGETTPIILAEAALNNLLKKETRKVLIAKKFQYFLFAYEYLRFKQYALELLSEIIVLRDDVSLSPFVKLSEQPKQAIRAYKTYLIAPKLVMNYNQKFLGQDARPQ